LESRAPGHRTAVRWQRLRAKLNPAGRRGGIGDSGVA